MGLYVVAISVSGSALFFRSKLNEITPGRQVVAGSGPLLSKDQLVEAAKRAYPDYTPRSVTLGRIPAQEVEILLTRGKKRKLRIFDPYTGHDLGDAVPYSLQLMSLMLDLHVNLLTGPTGRIVNGVCGILATLLAITGAVIWWPGVANWRRSLTINFRANWKRINWDLHSAVGFWTVAFFFMWSFTGVYLVFPEPFDNFIDHFAPLEYYKLASQEPTPSALFIRVAETVRRARPKIHYSAGDQVIRTFMGAHFGNFGGMGIRILWAIIGLTQPLLFITGTLMWWNRVLSKEARKLRRGTKVRAATAGE